MCEIEKLAIKLYDKSCKKKPKNRKTWMQLTNLTRRRYRKQARQQLKK